MIDNLYKDLDPLPSPQQLNKMALGHWVAHLRMTVYKGIEKHSSSHSPATIFDRPVVSLVMLTKLTECRTSTNKTCDIHGGTFFGLI